MARIHTFSSSRAYVNNNFTNQIATLIIIRQYDVYTNLIYSS